MSDEVRGENRRGETVSSASAHADFRLTRASDRSESLTLLQAVSIAAEEPFAFRPKCVSLGLTSYAERLNERLDDEDRQRLKPFIHQLIGTADDGLDDIRARVGQDWAIRVAVPRWLDAVGLSERAAQMRVLPEIVDANTAAVARTWTGAIWEEARAVRKKADELLVSRFTEELRSRGTGSALVAAIAAGGARSAAFEAAGVSEVFSIAGFAADVTNSFAANRGADVVVASAATAALVGNNADTASMTSRAVIDAASNAAEGFEDTDFEGFGDGYVAVHTAVYEAVRDRLKNKPSPGYAEVHKVTIDEAIETFGRMINVSRVGD